MPSAACHKAGIWFLRGEEGFVGADGLCSFRADIVIIYRQLEAAI